MATSPLFGWEEPDDVDLVKDGAAAIRTLGNAIDTSMGDLLGGTTGQVLSKASNTNMDFTWVTSDDANAIQNAIVDAKGDLIAASAADTPARLAVGNNGETLVADSSTSTGLRYQTGVNLNGVINGGFDIWQRNTSVTFASSATTTYNAADRWAFSHSGSSASTTISRQTATNNGSQYALRLQRVSGQTATPYYFLYNVLETSDTAKFAGKTVTLSVWVKTGANFSGANAYMQIRTGTGTDQSAQGMIDGTWTGYASNTNTISPTTTSQKFSYTITLSSTVTQLGIVLGYLTAGTAGANDWLEFEQVQLEVGSVATNFKRAGGTIQGELAACQRYYYRQSPGAAYSIFGTAVNPTSTQGNAWLSFPVTMRVAPTSVDTANLGIREYAGSIRALSSIVLDANFPNPNGVFIYGTITGGTVGVPAQLVANNSTSAYIGLSAEL